MKEGNKIKNPAIKTKTLFCVINSSFGFFINGSFVGWTSNAIDFLESCSAFNGNMSQISAIFALAATIGTLFVHLMWHHVGTKISILVSHILLLLAWVTVIFSRDYGFLLGARFIGGIAVGMQHLLITIYVNDLVSAHQKQLCFSILQLQFVSGVIFQYILRLFDDINIINTLPACISLISLVAIFFIPESPRYLLLYEKHEEAKLVLFEHRSDDHDVQNDIQLWTNFYHKNTYSTVLKEDLRILFTWFSYFLPVFGLTVFEQLIGAVPMLFYLQKIFERTDGEFTPETMTIVCGLVFGLGVIMQNIFISTNNNVLIKNYLMWSSNLMAIILCALGAFCHFQGSFDLNYTADYKNIPLILLSLFYFIFAIGIYRYSNEYSEQIIPKRCYFTVRCLMIAISWYIIYLITRILSQLIDNIGVGWLFWFIATTCVLMSVFIKLFLPSSSEVLEEIRLIDNISENCSEA